MLLTTSVGHALLDHHPGLVTKSQWRQVFGALQSQSSPFEYYEEDFVSQYAHSGKTVEEDFCESLIVWVRHKGKIRCYTNSRPDVYEKLQFISNLPNRVRNTGILR